MAKLGTAAHVKMRVDNAFWLDMTSSPAAVPLGNLRDSTAKLSGCAACCHGDAPLLIQEGWRAERGRGYALKPKT
jgi:hypothetical protein